MHRRRPHLTPLAAAVLIACASLAHAQTANTQNPTTPTVLKEVTVSGEHDSTNRVGFYNGVHWSDPRTVSLTLRGTF